MLHFKKLEKEEQTKSKANRKETVKIRAMINKIENRKLMKSTKPSQFFKKINKIDTLLAKLTKKIKSQIPKIRNKRGDITTILAEIKRYENTINN